MPLYDLTCECGHQEEGLVNNDLPQCPDCGATMDKEFPLIAYVKIKGGGGYPSRRKQVFNTTVRNHPKLNPDPNRVYFT